MEARRKPGLVGCWLGKPGRIVQVSPRVGCACLTRTRNQSDCGSHGNHVFSQRQREIRNVYPPRHASSPRKSQQGPHHRSRCAQCCSDFGIVAIGYSKCRPADSAGDQAPSQRGWLEAAGQQGCFVGDEFAECQFSGGVACQRCVEQRKGRVGEMQAPFPGRPTDRCRSSHRTEASYKSDTESAERRSAICHENQLSGVRINPKQRYWLEPSTRYINCASES